MILYVLKGKALQWVGGGMMFYACLIYGFCDPGILDAKYVKGAIYWGARLALR